MKRLFFLLPVILLLAMATVAKADSSDFKLEILDPPTGGPYLYYVTGTSPIAFQFGVCPSNLPPASSADGCFTAYNNSNTIFQSLSLAFDNYSSTTDPGNMYDYLNSQPASCDNTPGNSVFTSAPVCGLTTDLRSYNLVFSGGRGFYPGEYIVIAEFGASADAFRNGTFAVSSNLATPEPGTMWLLMTGAGMPAGEWLRRRRKTVAAVAA